MSDLISRQAAIDALQDRYKLYSWDDGGAQKAEIGAIIREIYDMPSAQPEEVIPHRNYKYFSDYWCECGWHLGKKGEVKYCSECGRKVNWDG